MSGQMSHFFAWGWEKAVLSRGSNVVGDFELLPNDCK
jgi:hypothetical protein